MAAFQTFEEIQAWQKARALTQQIYALSAREPFSRDFGLRDQVRRASTSIMSNIAEGFERNGRKEFLQFLAIAKGSAGEVLSHSFVAYDQGYLSEAEFSRIRESVAELGRLIGGLMQYLRGTKIRGIKYRVSATPNPKP
jgi:four helix bundle protein